MTISSKKYIAAFAATAVLALGIYGCGGGGGGSGSAPVTTEMDSPKVRAQNLLTGLRGTYDGRVDRSWTVELGEASISAASVFEGENVVWKVDGQTGIGSDSGSWEGKLIEPFDGGGAVAATGEFVASYGEVGMLVGAFGVELEE